MLNDEMVAALRESLDSDIVDRVLEQNLVSEKDIFSEIFENVMTHKERKKHGQFFTHKEII